MRSARGPIFSGDTGQQGGHQGEKQNLLSWTRGSFFNKTLLAQDFTYEYLSTEHEIWHSHFYKFWSPSEVLLNLGGTIKMV